MTSRDRDVAERLSRELGRPRRTRVDAGADAGDEECAALLELGSELQSIELPAPPEFQEELGRRLAAAGAARRRGLPSRFRAWLFPALTAPAALPSLRLALCALAILSAVLVLPRLNPFRAVSAADVLTRAQHAVASRIGRGEVMFRRWKIVERFSGPGAAADRVEVRYLDEWIDGGDIKHSVGKSLDASGHMYLAYIRERVGDGYVQRVYYEPGFAGEPRGLLSIVPDLPQFESAAERFSGRQRELLQEYLRRGYGPYEPLMREFRYNQAALASGTGSLALAPVSIRLEKPVRFEGESVFPVRLDEPVRVQFRWASSGPPHMWLDRGESIRYVSARTYLSQKIDTTSFDETGLQTASTRRVVDMRVFRIGTTGSDPFRLEVPEGTPVREQSAFAYLTGVAAALERAPAFESTRIPGRLRQRGRT